MAELPARAQCVVIGAGIVGNSLVYHLAELGWTDIVQLDKGPLPNPGGSTGHASNFIFPVPVLVSHISHVMTLEPGDVIITGTPAGIGPVKKGDLMRVEIERLGALENRVE